MMQNDVLPPALPPNQSFLHDNHGRTSSTLQQLRELNSKRRVLLAKCLGARSSDQLSSLLGTDDEKERLKRAKDGGKLKVDHETSTQTNHRVAKKEKMEKCTKNGGKSVKTDEKSTKNDEKLKRDEKSPRIDFKRRSHDRTAKSKSNSQESNGKAFVVAKHTVVNLDAPQPAAKRARARGDANEDEEVESFEDYYQVLQEEERIFRGSISFLKGTQSANPHNDYSQHFVDTCQRPQNFIRDAGLQERFDEYPKLKELMKLKDELVANTATPPMYLKADLHSFDLVDLGSRFDVILIEPPLPEYYHVTTNQCWTWDHIEQLDVPSLADSRCFLWLWCGSTPEGLDRGRQCLKRWGFRRCEDICWVKRNNNSYASKDLHKSPLDANALFQRTKEHCLMGIKGTVRRSTDGDFIHANVDIDLIITEEPTGDGGNSLEKPTEIFLIAEHFCLGRRRLHLFGRDDAIRPGWLTVGPSLTTSNFDARKYRRQFVVGDGSAATLISASSLTTGCTERIETLRPKSPPPPSLSATSVVSLQQTSTAAGGGASSSGGGSIAIGGTKSSSTLDKMRRKYHTPLPTATSSGGGHAFGIKSIDKTRRKMPPMMMTSSSTTFFRQERGVRTTPSGGGGGGLPRRHCYGKPSYDNRRR